LRLSTAVATFILAMSALSGEVSAGSTTGFTFDLPVGDTLTNAYVATASAANAAIITDYLLPSGSALINSDHNLSPAGFTVPGGDTAYNLVPVIGTTTGDNFFGVVALYTDPSSVEHVIFGSSNNLVGQPMPLDCPGGCTEAEVESWLSTGLVFGTSTGLQNVVFLGMLNNSDFAPLGTSVPLYEYSNGALLPGASVTANDFGTPVGTVGGVPTPEPASSLLLLGALGGLAVARRRSALSSVKNNDS